MQIKKKILCLFLAVVLTGGLGSPAAAADTENTVESLPDISEQPQGPATPEEEPLSLLDAEELSALVADFMAERDLSADNFAVAYCYTGTGESWSFNGDTYLHGASLYKLSLMMGLARKVAAGELQQTDSIYNTNMLYD